MKKTIGSKILAVAVAVTVMFSCSFVTTFADTNVATVDGIGYATLQEAVEATTTGTIKLNKDITENIIVAKGKTITIDLNEYGITNKGTENTILNNGILTIKGSGTIDNTVHAKAALYNNGTATLNGGTYTRSKENGSSPSEGGSNSFYNILNHGTMTINTGVVVKQTGSYSSLMENGWQDGNQNNTGENSVMTINGGTFSGGINTVKNDDYGVLTITDGTFENTTQASVLNWNKTEITGGSFESEKYAVLNGHINGTMDKGELIVDGGSFTAPVVLKEMRSSGSKSIGNIRLQAGTFNGDIVIGDSVALNGTGSLTISGKARINGNVKSTLSQDKIKISGGTVTGTVSAPQSNKITITAGTFGSLGEGTVVDSDTQAKVTSGDGTKVVIGEVAVKEAISSLKAGDKIEFNALKDTTVQLPEGVEVINKTGDEITVNNKSVANGETITAPENNNNSNNGNTSTDNTTDSATDDKKTESPKTGDNTMVMGYAIIMLAALGIGGTLAVSKRKN